MNEPRSPRRRAHAADRPASPSSAAGSAATGVDDAVRPSAAGREPESAGPPIDAPTTALTSRAERRETHSPRTTASIAAAILGILFCLYVLLEATLQAMGEEHWLLDPPSVGQWLVDLPDSDQLILGLVGAVAFLLGLLFFLQGILPGRRARFVLPNPRAAVVVDAEVLAASLARRARQAAGVSQEQVVVTVGRRSVEVSVRPTSGIPVNADAVQRAVEDELLLTNLDPQPRVTVQVAPIGAIGQ